MVILHQTKIVALNPEEYATIGEYVPPSKMFQVLPMYLHSSIHCEIFLSPLADISVNIMIVALLGFIHKRSKLEHLFAQI